MQAQISGWSHSYFHDLREKYYRRNRQRITDIRSFTRGTVKQLNTVAETLASRTGSNEESHIMRAIREHATAIEEQIAALDPSNQKGNGEDDDDDD
ncbi:hypothetical protein FOZ63_014910 [Perkinsus olseni]|nr:hypothetical protein FOZ63_014910 [Perkinsus olseni]